MGNPIEYPHRLKFFLGSGVFLILMGIYTVCMGGEIAYTQDSNPVVAVTETFLETGSYATPLKGDPPYSIYGLGMSLWYTPIRWGINQLFPEGLTLPIREYWRRQGYMFLNVLASAGIGWLLVAWSLNLGFSARGTLLGSLCYGLATLQMPYARYDFTEPVSAFFLFGGAYFLWRYSCSSERGVLFLSGVFLGAGSLTRFPVGIPAVLFLFFVAYRAWERKRFWDPVLYLLPLAASLGVILMYNYARFGDVWETGYPIHFDTPLWKGIAGLLVSPGQGLLFYSPVSVVGLLVLFANPRFDRFLKVLSAVTMFVFLLLNAKWRYWYGGWSWGPRLLLPVLPFTGLGLAGLFSATSYRLIWGLLLFGTGGLVNFLAIYVPYSDYHHTLQVNGISESAALWNPKYSILRIQHEYLSQVYWRNYDFMWLRRADWGWMVWVVAGFGVLIAGVGIRLIRMGCRVMEKGHPEVPLPNAD